MATGFVGALVVRRTRGVGWSRVDKREGATISVGRGGIRSVISVGVAGLGYWGPNLVRNVNACSCTRLAWLCDIDAERLDAIGRQHPGVRRSTCFTEMLADDDLDAVAIATPVATHYELTKAALRAGKHVLVEKPLTASVRDAAELVTLAEEVDRVLL